MWRVRATITRTWPQGDQGHVVGRRGVHYGGGNSAPPRLEPPGFLKPVGPFFWVEQEWLGSVRSA